LKESRVDVLVGATLGILNILCRWHHTCGNDDATSKYVKAL